MELTRLIILFAFMFEAFLSLSQTSNEKDAENAQKYWVYRDRFRKHFVNIGALNGQSLPFLTILEGYNSPIIKSTDLSQQNPPTSTLQGRVGKGEMGIELGHYLAVLATEYRLLERDGADLTSIRNELYYAINAVNRLDKNAEPYYDLSISSNNSSNLNGFLIREDIPHGFYRRWRDVGDNINNQGSENSGIFAFEINTFQSQPRFFDESGNVIIEDSDENTVVDERFDHDYNHRKKYGNKWNEFSQDQLIGLLLGLRFVVKFVDNDFVKPTSADPGFYIITETKNIIERLLDHTAEIKDCGSQIQHTDDGSCSQLY